VFLGGLDIGTTGCKISVYDENGSFIFNSYREYKSERNNSVHEIDAAEVWASVAEVMNEALGKCDISVVGVTSFGESFVMLDKNDNILLPSMLYTDKRGNEECKIFNPEMVEEITGITPHGMYSLPKIMWIKNNLPETYAKADKILLFQDFVVYKLTGVAQMDYSLACRTMAFDIRKKCWSKKMFDIAGVDSGLLSKLVPSGSVAGKIIAPEIRNGSDTTIVTAFHDQLAAILGAGVFDTESAMDGTGTVECIVPVFDDIPNGHDFYSKGYAIVPHIEDGKYICYVLSYTGGAAIKWYKDNFFKSESYLELDSNIGDDPSGILIMPHFAGAATPYMDENSRAVFAGITLGTTKYDIYRAIMEGVAYESLISLDVLKEKGIGIAHLYATGGGAKSEKWLQIKADILNTPITSVDIPEVGAMGTVIISGYAIGVFDSLKNASKRFLKLGKTFTPNKEMNQKYMEIYEKYKKLYSSVRPII